MATLNEQNAGLGAFTSPGVDAPANPGNAAITTGNPVVSFKLHNVDPPSSLYINQTDRLLVVAANSDANVGSIQLQGRILRAADGEISPFVLFMPIGAARAITRANFDLTEGYLLTLECVGTGGTTQGRCFLQVSIERGSFPGNTEYFQLISDYVSRAHNPTWPGGRYTSSIDGNGWVHSVALANPAAGADLAFTVPVGARWKFRAARFNLVTSAAAANRSVRFIMTDAVNTVFFGGFNFIQAASLTEAYSIGIGTSPLIDTAGLTAVAPIPDNFMFAGFTFQTVTQNIQAGDQFSLIFALVEEWIEL